MTFLKQLRDKRHISFLPCKSITCELPIENPGHRILIAYSELSQTFDDILADLRDEVQEISNTVSQIRQGRESDFFLFVPVHMATDVF